MRYLERDACVIGDVRSLGCCLWADYDLYRDRERSMKMAGLCVRDHVTIRSDGGGRFLPEHALEDHEKSLAWLHEQLAIPFDGRTVVVTHHGVAPLYGSTGHFQSGRDIAERFPQSAAGACQFARRVVFVAAVRSLELAAVDGHHVTRQQLQSATQFDETTAYVTNGWPVVAAEVGDHLEVGTQTPRQPHHLHVALALALKTPAGRYPVQIPVDIDLEHHARMIGRATRESWRGAVESKFREIQLFDKGIDDPDRVVLPDVVIDTFGK